MSAGKKKIPDLQGDAAAERFVAEANLADYDLTGFRPMHFEFEKKTKQVNLRMPEGLLEAVKARAAARQIPYQRFIREVLEKALRQG